MNLLFKKWHLKGVAVFPCLCACLIVQSLRAEQMPGIEVHGLFKDRALVSIDGVQHVLKTGDQVRGIRLIRADSRAAVVSWEDQELELFLSRQLAGGFQPVDVHHVSIQLNNQGQYRTTGSINNVPISFLVDTGASIVAMNSQVAKRLNLDYTSGIQGETITAGGPVRSWKLVLGLVQVGAIKRYNVSAAVLEGSYPAETLLGMTFLQQVEITKGDGVMVLTSKF